jgi:DNA (cytosine-5)-methyltransferase 1
VHVLDVFAGAGGLSTGLAQAGFHIVAGAEWDADACATFAAAHPSADVLEGDVGAMSFAPWRGAVDVVVGGPPCQPWSTGGKRLGSADPRDGWPPFLRVIREVRPRALFVENVTGFTLGPRQRRFDALRNELAGLGYTVSASVENAADHGAPQKRQRLVIVACAGAPSNSRARASGPARGRPPARSSAPNRWARPTLP